MFFIAHFHWKIVSMFDIHLNQQVLFRTQFNISPELNFESGNNIRASCQLFFHYIVYLGNEPTQLDTITKYNVPKPTPGLA